MLKAIIINCTSIDKIRIIQNFFFEFAILKYFFDTKILLKINLILWPWYETINSLTIKGKPQIFFHLLLSVTESKFLFIKLLVSFFKVLCWIGSNKTKYIKNLFLGLYCKLTYFILTFIIYFDKTNKLFLV